MSQPEAEFLHQRKPSFHASDEVELVVNYLRAGGERIANEPADKIAAHIGFLANREYANDGVLTGDQPSMDRQIDAHVIKAGDVPEGYFDLQRRIAREQGHGTIEISSEMRDEATKIISADQRHTLKPWLDYLAGGEAQYPDWFKMYAFNGIVRMGKIDKAKEEFQKRSNLTTVPFPELSRGALSQVHSWVTKSHMGVPVRNEQGEIVIDTQTGKPEFDYDVGVMFEDQTVETSFQKALKKADFAKLYVHAIRKTEEGTITPEQRKQIQGSWKRYSQNSDPAKLHGDLQGFGLDWCTATGYETAVSHLARGDFLVYYTPNKDGKDTVPRVAVRMEDGEVAEVRGVNASQELEPKMADVTAERLTDLPGGDEYIRKAEDMKRLTTIEKKIATDPHALLQSDEIRFLYELDRDIQGFGYKTDPRIAEIRTKRGDSDKSELAIQLTESIREQVQTAYTAYRTVADKLQGTKRGMFGNRKAVAESPGKMAQIFAIKDEEWQANGTYAHLVEQLMTSGTRVTLVATPNVAASEAQIVGLAEDFGKAQPFRTLIRDDLYKHGLYSDAEWSGHKGSETVRLSLMPSKVDSEISFLSIREQKRLLSERQAKQPDLNVRVPSLLDAVSYWYALRARGEKLIVGSFNKTYIRHFDLEPRMDGLLRIPDSLVGEGGVPDLSLAHDIDIFGARLTVG